MSYHDLKTLRTQQIEQAARAHELQLAHTIQTGMTPRTMPRLAGFDFGSRMEPAGGSGR